MSHLQQQQQQQEPQAQSSPPLPQQQQQFQELQHVYQSQLEEAHQQYSQQISVLMAQINDMKQQILVQQQPQQQIKDLVDIEVDSDVHRGIIRSEYGKASVQAATNKFTGDHTTFPLWSKTMETILSNVGLSDLLTQEVPVSANDKSNKLRIDNAMMILLGGLSSNIALKYTSTSQPKQVWDSLKSEYNRITETTQSVARKEFSTCKQRPGEKVKDFTQRLQTCMVRLECMNVPVSISEFKHQLYEGLTEDYTSCISQLKLQGISDINKIIEHIHDQGVMIEAKQNLSGDETANYVGNRGNGANRNNRNWDNRRSGGAQNGNTFTGNCYNCNKEGHRSRHCPEPIQPCQFCGKQNHVSNFCFYKSQPGHNKFDKKSQSKSRNVAQMVLELQAAVAKLSSGNNTDQANHVNEQSKASDNGGSK